MDFSKIDPMEKPTLILRNLDGTAIQTLGYAINVRINPYYNEISELNFDIPAEVDGVPTPNYALVVGMRIVEVMDVGQFLLVDPTEDSDGLVKKKSCKAYSLEYEFAKKEIYIPEGTYQLYNALTPENTILGMILEKMPDWQIGDISRGDFTKYRTFGDTRAKIYNFIKSDVQETYGCIFDFDTMNRRINIIDISADVPVKRVYLSPARLLKTIKLNEDSDGIITCLDVSGSEGVNIRSVNPTGKNVIYNLDYFLSTDNFSQELIDKWRAWEMAVEGQREAWKSLMKDYNMQSVAVMTQEAALADLQGELTVLEGRQAVIIQAIAQNLGMTQEDLDDINGEIEAQKTRIAAKRHEIDNMRAVMEADQASMRSISASLDFEDTENCFFTEGELKVLRRYFLEDSLEDSSFEVDLVETYNDTPHTGAVANCSMSVYSDAPIEAAGGLFACGSGRITVTSDILTAETESATLYVPPGEGSGFVFTATVRNGTLRDTQTGDSVSFERGNLTVSGEYAALPTADGAELTLRIQHADLYFTRNSTSYEVMTVEEALYEYGKKVLREKSSPVYHFEMESGDFFSAEDFAAFKNEFALGSRVYLQLGEDEVPLRPYVVGAEIHYGEPSATKLEFSSDYSAYDRSFALTKLLEQSVSMGRTLNAKSGAFASFVSSGASNRVKEFMESALDVAKNTVLSSGSQALEFGDAGIRVRKWNAERTGYEPEEVWIVDNVIAFTDDNWATAKMALGRIFDENLKSDANPQGTAYGLAAPYIVGTILAGENLIIDTENGDFRVDGSGVHIDSLKMYIHPGSAGTTETLASRLNTIDRNASEMGDAIDGLREETSVLVTTYYDSTVPESPRVGDLWFVTADVAGTSYRKNRLYRYTESAGIYTWVEIKDADAVQAIGDAASAQSTADRKIQTFYQPIQPTPEQNPDEGDLWFRTSEITGDRKLLRYTSGVWEPVEDGGISLLDGRLGTIETSLGDLIRDNGFLSTDKLSGFIDAGVNRMRSQTGNVLFDSDGLWLLNAKTKEGSTRAVWLGEKGIAFGSGSMTPDPGAEDSGWSWVTFIGHDGVAANALASTYLSAIHIRGGDIQIGDNFAVDERGNLTANNGTFKGTLNAPNLKGKLTGEDGAWLIGAGLSVGPGADEHGGNFYVDPGGNVTMSGSITLNGSITWGSGNSPVQVQYSADGSSAWHSDLRNGDFYAKYSYDGGRTWTEPIRFRGQDGRNGSDASVPNYIRSSYIDEAKILSPDLLGGHIYATGKGSDNGAAFYICNGVSGSGAATEPNDTLAYISYDTTGAGTAEEEKNRVIFRTLGVPLKLLGDSHGISLGTTGGGKIYIDSDIQFKSGINITGLTATFG